MSKDGVEGAIGEGQAVDICNLEVRVRHPPRNAQSLCLCNLRRLEVDADRLSGGDGLGKSKRNDPGPQPRSNTRIPARSIGRKKAASLAAVRRNQISFKSRIGAVRVTLYYGRPRAHL